MKELSEIIEYLNEAVVEATLGNLGKETITGDSLLMEDLGLDSLDYASVMLAGETFVEHKVNENNVNWREVRSVAQLAELLYKCQF